MFERMKSKTLTVVMVICSVLSIGMIGLAITVDHVFVQTEDTTALYTATVRNVDITDTGKQIFADIYVEEYNAYLGISSNITPNIDMSAVKALDAGETIFFRIEKDETEMWDEVIFLNIVSLQTEEKEIFTLEEYNTCMKNAVKPAKIVGFVVAVLLLFVAVISYIAIRKKTRQSQ